MNKRFKFWLQTISLLLLTATSVNAAPIIWTIPSTSIGSGNTLSGTFIYDAVTSQFTNPNITVTGALNETYTFPAGVLPRYGLAQLTAVASNGDHLFFIHLAGVPANGGSYTSNQMGIASCFSFSSPGLCSNGLVISQTLSVTISGAAPPVAPVPTLSEYGLAALALLMMGTGFAAVRRKKM